MERYGRDAILEIAQSSRDERVRLNGWKLIAEYAYGRPPDTVQLDPEIQSGQDQSDRDGRVIRMVDSIAARLRAADDARAAREQREQTE
ncbi:MAG TPA: hypothetical protein VJT33_04060 [bacterium]|nr:hypothetical protein [bacterium]